MKYNGNNLKEVLDSHKRWLNESEGWSEEDKANLRGADLRGADLRGADLRETDLRETDLSEFNLRLACLIGVDLMGANLREAYLSGANLREAYLSEADLRGADLSFACLIGADLRRADLRGADLRRADLRGADLKGVDLKGVDLRGACLSGADLRGAKNIPFIPLACPNTGAFVAWKICGSENGPVIIKLLIPEDARRSSGTGRKCRADKAVVLEIQTIDGDTLEGAIAWSMHDAHFTYKVGETVTPNKPFCEDRFEECSSGIHFFINRQEAVEYC